MFSSFLTRGRLKYPFTSNNNKSNLKNFQVPDYGSGTSINEYENIFGCCCCCDAHICQQILPNVFYKIS